MPAPVTLRPTSALVMVPVVTTMDGLPLTVVPVTVRPGEEPGAVAHGTMSKPPNFCT